MEIWFAAKRLLQRVRRIRHRDTRHSVMYALLSRADLHRILMKERARSDRSGQTLYWLLVKLEKCELAGRDLERLAEILVNRARQTDVIGRFDQNALCAILPETKYKGVQQFIFDLLSLAVKNDLVPSVRLYSYPEESISGYLEHKSSGDMYKEPLTALGLGRSSVPAGCRNQLDIREVKELLVLPMPWWKRVIDIAGALAGLVIASPILTVIALAVKATSHGPVLFIQPRAGLGGRRFHIYKFRTMHVDAEKRKAMLGYLNEQDGPAFKIRDDPRVTSLGRILRRLSLDELPQLFNVLKGDMSLVGPRPPTFEEVAEYRAWYTRRLDVTPGITCIWQVYGRSRVSFEDWMRMDMQYIRQYSFWQDLRLLMATVPAVLMRRGAY